MKPRYSNRQDKIIFCLVEYTSWKYRVRYSMPTSLNGIISQFLRMKDTRSTKLATVVVQIRSDTIIPSYQIESQSYTVYCLFAYIPSVHIVQIEPLENDVLIVEWKKLPADQHPLIPLVTCMTM